MDFVISLLHVPPIQSYTFSHILKCLFLQCHPSFINTCNLVHIHCDSFGTFLMNYRTTPLVHNLNIYLWYFHQYCANTSVNILTSRLNVNERFSRKENNSFTKANRLEFQRQHVLIVPLFRFSMDWLVGLVAWLLIRWSWLHAQWFSILTQVSRNAVKYFVSYFFFTAFKFIYTFFNSFLRALK